MRRKVVSKDLRRMCIIAHRTDEVIFRAAIFVQGPKYFPSSLTASLAFLQKCPSKLMLLYPAELPSLSTCERERVTNR